MKFKGLHAAEGASNASGATVRGSEVVLPQPDDGPACGAEGAFDGGVALAVAAKFGEPVCAVAARLAAMLRATMPEAAVNEDGEALAPKDEIGMAGHGLVPTPTGDVGGAQDGCEL